MDYDFPELEEFFIYNPKTTGTGNPMQTSTSTGIKMTKDSVAYCTSGLVDRNKEINTFLSSQSN